MASWFEAMVDAVDWAVVGEVAGAVMLAFVVSWAFRRFVLTRFERMADRTDNDVDDRLVYFLRRFYNAILLLVVLAVVLKILDVELTPLLAGAGIAGIAIAYAAKDIIGNFLSGIFLLVDRPIKIGDRIRIERIGSDWGAWGDVVDVGLRTTTVRNTDGVLVTYPNARLAESVIMNFSPSGHSIRFRVRVLVDPDCDLERALGVLEEAARARPEVLLEPAPSALVRSLVREEHGALGQGALLELRCHVEDIRVRTRLRSSLLIDIQRRLRAAGIGSSQLHVSATTTRASEDVATS